MFKSQKGFTLVELLIYLGIFALAAGLLTGIMIAITRAQGREAAAVEVTQQLSYVQTILQGLVRESSNIYVKDSDAGKSLDKLTLRMASTDLDPTEIYLKDEVIYLKQPKNDKEIPLTSDRIKVTNFKVTKYENPGGHALVQIDLILGYNTQNIFQKVSRNLQISIGRVTAATFDDNLLPNTSDSAKAFSLGSASAQWENLYLSNILKLGVLGNEPSACVPGSLYYNNLTQKGFRGCQDNNQWVSLGAGYWTASTVGNYTNISNTNNGYVGIGTGTTAPNFKLDVRGNTAVNGGALYVRNNPEVAWDFLKLSTGGAIGRLDIKQVDFRIGLNNDTNNAETFEDIFSITQDGNVGIRTTQPQARLHVQGGIEPAAVDQWAAIIENIQTTDSGEHGLLVKGGLGDNSANTLFEVQGQETTPPHTSLISLFRVRKELNPRYYETTFPNGNVGIGTSTPASLFTVATSSNIFNVLSSGNVGIGTTNPKGKLDIAGGISVGSYAGVNTPPSNGMIISGNVGIGTTNPGAALEVKGTMKVFGDWLGLGNAAKTVRQASSDGFVVAWVDCSGGWIKGLTDSGTSPATERIRSMSNITMPVKKGDYWKIETNCSDVTAYWIPLGT